MGTIDNLISMTLGQMDALWNEAKEMEKSGENERYRVRSRRLMRIWRQSCLQTAMLKKDGMIMT